MNLYICSFINSNLADKQANYGQNLRQIYADFFYMKNTTLKSMAELDSNTVNMLDINNSELTTTETFMHCTELDKMKYYGKV